jgi:hypothetical protein
MKSFLKFQTEQNVKKLFHHSQTAQGNRNESVTSNWLKSLWEGGDSPAAARLCTSLLWIER